MLNILLSDFFVSLNKDWLTFVSKIHVVSKDIKIHIKQYLHGVTSQKLSDIFITACLIVNLLTLKPNS